MVIENIIKLNLNKKKILLLLNMAVTLIFLFLMAYSFSRPLRNFVYSFTGNSIIVITIYCFLFYCLYFLTTFIFKYYEAFGLEYRADKLEKKLKPWFDQLLQKELIVFCFLFIVVQVIYFFLETSVQWWWMPVSIFCVIMRCLIEIGPKYILPWFSSLKILEDGLAKSRLIELLARAHMKVSNVFLMDNPKAQAILLGMGAGRKLLISNAINEYAKEEIEVIVAMEMAEHYYGNIWKRHGIEAIGMFIVFLFVNILLRPVSEYFGFEFIFDIETLPVLIGLFLIIFVIASMVQNIFFRKMQKQADSFALELTNAPDAFISLIIRKTQQDPKDLQFSDFLEQVLSFNASDTERMAIAQDFAQSLSFKEKHRE